LTQKICDEDSKYCLNSRGSSFKISHDYEKIEGMEKVENPRVQGQRDVVPERVLEANAFLTT
jgi:hypothetical protein